MTTKRRRCVLGLLFMLTLLLTACGNGNAASTDGPPRQPGELEVTAVGTNLAFEQTTINVRAGQAVTLTLNNGESSLEHNWVLVRGGEDVARTVAGAALTAGRANHYLPSDSSDILAATQVLPPGEVETINFVAPEPGIYFYICTVPGHYPLMRGRLVVEE
ncbi:plastocyanin/azurin family copper-binding protein [Candidatus Viridilinea mediisalina]|uniref:Blue (type 1) copper domain-containing protein n=1 Tax=Candidatus Viridilinea mediisalina TaxID=2024553 RepID=A0A2A6RLB1_9CHLR|nr:plastocyanin/azurin family copper-binding protein [Candidatus Viridilinea mediisalina]PDW03701.1 hypothetical protein CJ255_07275 [Candidatus Viridilinea mediisalina]